MKIQPTAPIKADEVGTEPFSRRTLGVAGLRVLGAVVLAGLLSAHRSWSEALTSLFPLTLLALAAMALVAVQLRASPARRVERSTAELLVWSAVILAAVGVQVLAHAVNSPESGMGFLYAAPLVAGAMLVSALLGPSKGLMAMSVAILLVGVAEAAPWATLMSAWFAGAIGAHVVNPMKRRSDLLRAVTLQTGLQAALAACVVAVAGENWVEMANGAGWAAIAALLAVSLFWLGTVLFERWFGVVSDWSLLELCSPEHPLLHELNLRAPGTYAHSVMVGNLAEAGAREVGANPVLCRAMAYFHDIGKTVRPSYFTENQAGANLHDDLPPEISARIIVAHVEDGLRLGQEHRLPTLLLDGIAQHHGTTLVRYFYRRALQESAEGPTQEGDFRYPGPKPQSTEAAILHLADSVEAAARACPPGADLGRLVQQILDDSRTDGQLDESELTFRDLTRIREAFLRTLGAMRHDRVPYPEPSHAAEPDPGEPAERIGP